jgi:hypothetical protein
MNVEIVAEAALFPEKEYINRIAIAVHIVHDLMRYLIHRMIFFQNKFIWCNVFHLRNFSCKTTLVKEKPSTVHTSRGKTWSFCRTFLGSASHATSPVVCGPHPFIY